MNSRGKELFTQEVSELISSKPSWVVRNGNIVLATLVCLFFIPTWFIPYPNTINGSATLVAVNAPKLLTATAEGRLERLLVTNEQFVNENQPLAFLESTADHQEVLLLSSWLKEVSALTFDDGLDVLAYHPLPFLPNLGEIHPDFQEFKNVLTETLETLPGGYYEQKNLELQKDLLSFSELHNSIERQLALSQADFKLQEIEYSVSRTLADSNLIAPLEFVREESKLIAKKQRLEQISNQIMTNKILMHSKKREMIDLKKLALDQKQRFLSALFDLKNQVDNWISDYVVTSPLDGHILFVRFLEENQLLRMDQEMFYIQPQQNEYYGQAVVSQSGLGKIKKNQTILINVESFPSAEFGHLIGSVEYISNIPTSSDSFLIKVDLPYGLTTNYNKELSFRNNLKGEARIVVEDSRLVDRFWYRFKSILKD